MSVCTFYLNKTREKILEEYLDISSNFARTLIVFLTIRLALTVSKNENFIEMFVYCIKKPAFPPVLEKSLL